MYQSIERGENTLLLVKKLRGETKSRSLKIFSVFTAFMAHLQKN